MSDRRRLGQDRFWATVAAAAVFASSVLVLASPTSEELLQREAINASVSAMSDGTGEHRAILQAAQDREDRRAVAAELAARAAALDKAETALTQAEGQIDELEVLVKRLRAEAAVVASRSSSSGPKAYARGRLSATQFVCLDNLWTRESGWRWNATNPSSGAYGIPQSLPGSKMAAAGADWRTNPITQINWGLGYIADVYGTSCSAWSHFLAYNWY